MAFVLFELKESHRRKRIIMNETMLPRIYACLEGRIEEENALIISTIFLVIISFSTGMLLFILILVVYEAKQLKKKKVEQSSRPSVSYHKQSTRRRSSNVQDLGDMYTKIDSEYLTVQGDDDLEGDQENLEDYRLNDRNTSQDISKNAEIILRELFVVPSRDAIYENVDELEPEPESDIVAKKSSLKARTKKFITDQMENQGITFPKRKISFNHPTIHSTSTRPSMSVSVMSNEDRMYPMQHQQRRRQAVVFSNQISIASDPYNTIV